MQIINLTFQTVTNFLYICPLNNQKHIFKTKLKAVIQTALICKTTIQNIKLLCTTHLKIPKIFMIPKRNIDTAKQTKIFVIVYKILPLYGFSALGSYIFPTMLLVNLWIGVFIISFPILLVTLPKTPYSFN